MRVGMMPGVLALHELTPRANWRHVRMPDWVDENTRVYHGFRLTVAGREWTEIVTHFDGKRTTAYVTANGFNIDCHGPVIESVAGKAACHRKVVRTWFRRHCNMEIEFK